MIKLDDIAVFSLGIRPASPADLKELERRFETKLPAGYADFVTTFGDGILNSYLSVATPRHLLDGRVAESRERWARNFRWGNAASSLPRSAVERALPIASTTDGDEAIVVPGLPDAIHLLPVNDDLVRLIGTDLWSALSWFYSADGYADPPRINCFQPAGAACTVCIATGGLALFTQAREAILRGLPDIILEEDRPDPPRDDDDEGFWLHLYSGISGGQVMAWYDEDEGTANARFYYSPVHDAAERDRLLAKLTSLGFRLEQLDDPELNA